jgi:xylose dehydrogenase (NAD/NADP)
MNQDSENRRPYRVGLIGTGIMGTNHGIGYMLNPRTELAAVADSDPENLERFARRFGISNTYSSYEEMFAKENLDIAAPILPAGPNPYAVIAAARAGVRAIFCEKPICASLEDADRMVAEISSQNIPWAAADAMRNLPQFWQIKEMIDSGELGEVRTINIYLGTGDGRGEIWGANCQDLSVARLFADDADVDWVVGWVRGDPFDDVDQAMGGHIRFENGIECFIHMKAESRRGIEIITSKGMVFSDYHTFRLWKLQDRSELRDLAEIPNAFPDAGLNEMPFDERGWRYPGNRMKASIQAIVDCLDEGVPPKCSGENMAKVLEILIALRESHRRGHAPVKLPLEDRSLRIEPLPYRWINRKEVFGPTRYEALMSVHIKETG